MWDGERFDRMSLRRNHNMSGLECTDLLFSSWTERGERTDQVGSSSDCEREVDLDIRTLQNLARGQTGRRFAHNSVACQNQVAHARATDRSAIFRTRAC